MSDRRQTSPNGGHTCLTGTAKCAVCEASGFDARAHDLDTAVCGLFRVAPEFSARATIWAWQRDVLLIACAMLGVALVLWPGVTMAVVFAVLAVPFLFVAAIRVAAIWQLCSRGGADGGAQAGFSEPAPVSYPDDDTLPRYAVLVPLFDEAHVVPGLLRALRRINYPRDKLEISIITESVDRATRAALEGAKLDDHMRVVVVPDGLPRTKPRALNFALASAVGDIVVVYDAEDEPEPDQLIRAVAQLSAQPCATGCIQACLNIYNPRVNWLTRQFTIEYTGLFDALLPALARLNLPVPLGGTSNHFLRANLEGVGAWDPFNVTEDADLGIRLARFGLSVGVNSSTTWEEAPEKFNVWLGQRTRWMKGWMQTYLVHMREPRRLKRELGIGGFLGLQVLMVGMILSPLVHPIFYIAVFLELFIGGTGAFEYGDVAGLAGVARGSTLGHSAGQWFLWIGIVNLVIGYASAIVLGAISVARRGWRYLMLDCLTMPVYWLLISLGAYRALIELARAPHYWEKTDHAKVRNWKFPATR